MRLSPALLDRVVEGALRHRALPLAQADDAEPRPGVAPLGLGEPGRARAGVGKSVKDQGGQSVRHVGILRPSIY